MCRPKLNVEKSVAEVLNASREATGDLPVPEENVQLTANGYDAGETTEIYNVEVQNIDSSTNFSSSHQLSATSSNSFDSTQRRSANFGRRSRRRRQRHQENTKLYHKLKSLYKLARKTAKGVQQLKRLMNRQQSMTAVQL